jgi:hypothetical protein
MEDIIETTDDGQIRIIFEKTDGVNNYRDALYYRADVYPTVDPAEIEMEKDRRFNNWLEAIKGVPDPVPEETAITLPGLTEPTPTPTIQELLQQG